MIKLKKIVRRVYMRKILLLLSNGFEALEASAFTDVFGWNMVVGSRDIQVVTASIDNPISTTWNFTVSPEILVRDLDLSEYSALVIPGGFGKAGFFMDTKKEEFLHVIRHFFSEDKIIAGVCTGVIPMAESGILKGRRATTYLHDNERYFKQLEINGAIPNRVEIERDGSIITSSGPATAVKVAFLLLEILTDPGNTEIVKTNMGY